MLPYRPGEPLSLAGTDVLIASGGCRSVQRAGADRGAGRGARSRRRGGAGVSPARRPRAHAGRPRHARGLGARACERRMSTPIPASTEMGAVHLTVGDLERSLEYYREAIGLRCSRKARSGDARAPASDELLVLVEEPGARPAPATPASTTSPCCCPSARSRALARPRRCASGCGCRAVGPLRERGDLPQRSGQARHRDLLGPPARALGRAGVRAAWPRSARCRRPHGRARRPRVGAVRAASGGHRHGPRPPEGGVDPRAVAFYRDVLGFGLMAAARRAGGVPLCRRLPPPRRREHLGKRRRVAAAGRAPPPCAASTIVLPDAAERDRAGRSGCAARSQRSRRRTTGRASATRRGTRSRC